MKKSTLTLLRSIPLTSKTLAGIGIVLIVVSVALAFDWLIAYIR